MLLFACVGIQTKQIGINSELDKMKSAVTGL